MFETLFAQNSSEQATSTSIIIAVVSSFFLSSLIVLTYEITHKGKPKSANFLMSLALISIVAATVMQAVGDSLARGLGMLGALAIIRFRTNLNNPLSITYMFATLAVGISCGVFGFTVAFAGTFTFCIAALLLHFSPFLGTENFRGTLKVTLELTAGSENDLEVILRQYCKSFNLDQVRIESNEVEVKIAEVDPLALENPPTPPPTSPVRTKEYTYHVWMRDQADAPEMMEKVYRLDRIKSARIRFSIPDVSL